MIELYQLEQLVTFHEYGTLSGAAEVLHISQPTLTRSMQKLEAEFGVSLFVRSKNRLEFNENGNLAAEHAKKLLNQTQDMVDLIRALDRASHTFAIGSCAPMPMMDMVQQAARFFPEMTVSFEMKPDDILLDGLRSKSYQLIILPYQPEGGDLCWKPWGSERLYFTLPLNHSLAGRSELYLNDLDGENMLLFSDIGFWHNIHAQKMPHSRFLVQNERFAFDELLLSSVLPAFTSDIILKQQGAPKDRVAIPILDPEVSVTYYNVCLNTERKRLKGLV